MSKQKYPSLEELRKIRKEMIDKKETGLRKLVDAAIHVVAKSDMLIVSPGGMVTESTSHDSLDSAEEWTDTAIELTDRILGLLQDHINEINARKIEWFLKKEASDVS